MDQPTWDPDRPWCWATDDGWNLELPPDAATILGGVLDAATDPNGLSDGLTVEVADPDGGGETWTGDQLALLAAGSADTLRRLLAGSSTVGGEELWEAADAAQVLAVLCHLRLGHPGGDVDRPLDDLLRWAAATDRLYQELSEALMRRIRARRDGTFRVALSALEQQVIDEGLAQLETVLGADDPALHRLLPTAYPDDPDREAGWAALVHDELISNRRATIARVRSLLDRRHLDADELSALMRCLNDLRLVLGTRLDVGEDGLPAGGLRSEDRPALALYEHLGMLVAEIVRALRSTL